MDEDSHLIHTIGLSDSLLFKYSKENLADYNLVYQHDGIRNQENYKGNDYWLTVNHQSTKTKGKVIGFDNPAFLPGAIGWNLGRLISKKVYISYYLGRIINVLAYALLVFIAIKISAVFKPVLYVMGTLPSTIYVISGFHYDYLYYGASLIIIGILTNVLSERKKITTLNALAFQTLSFLFAFSKFPFILVGSLMLILPKRYYQTKKTRLVASGMFFIMMILSLIYSGIINIIPMAGSVTGKSPGILYFIKHPLPIIRTIMDIPHVILDNFVGHPLQYVSHQSSLLITLNMLAFIVLLFICSTQWKFKIPIWFQVYTLALFLGIASLMIFAITGDPRVYHEGDILVGGVQGRYYYFMVTMLPVFIGYWINSRFDIKSFTEIEENKFYTVLQYTIVF
ncbi:DUF2142 domain-containing protein [Streptococcus phocae]|uniref:DUF2142 domain-containing protein n=1 Tax=Streptococcus phocae TaxID=119224 RepID=UPI001F180AB8|nr:DUF2142 domain-containing protein [Streptococcus phocae]